MAMFWVIHTNHGSKIISVIYSNLLAAKIINYRFITWG
jgi:hypothetical protein